MLTVSPGGSGGTRAAAAAVATAPFTAYKRRVKRAGAVALPLKLRGRARDTLVRVGRVRIPLVLTFTPSGPGRVRRVRPIVSLRGRPFTRTCTTTRSKGKRRK